MTATETTTRARPARSLRRLAVTASAGILLTMIPVGTAGADTFIDPNDRCLPEAEAPPAPASDRDEIAPAHVASVDCAYALGIAIGYGDGTYRPLAMTTRAQMASFIVRSLQAAGYDLPPAEDSGFTDIEGNEHEGYIELLATIGVTSGTTTTTYSPDELVRRDQMATFIVQAAEYAFGDTEFLVGDEPVPAFDDVQADSRHYDNVNTAAQVLGLASGLTEDIFDPGSPTTRQQMASFLVRLVDLTLIVE